MKVTASQPLLDDLVRRQSERKFVLLSRLFIPGIMAIYFREVELWPRRPLVTQAQQVSSNVVGLRPREVSSAAGSCQRRVDQAFGSKAADVAT